MLEPSVFRFRHIEARRYRLPGTLYIGFDYQLRNGNEYSRTFAIRYWDGIALFCKRNVSFLYNSIPQRGSYITPGNKPDLRRLRLTEGVVEFARITGARYSGDKIFVNWETRRYMYGEMRVYH